MNFSSINIQGNIVSSEILDKIRSEEKYKHQQPEAFGLARTASLRDEIGLAWSVMRSHWQAYKKRLETLPRGDTGTSLTRKKLILPFLSELGYETIIQRAQLVGGKSYAISHKHPIGIIFRFILWDITTIWISAVKGEALVVASCPCAGISE